jgi:hypothetical protein
VATVAQLAAYVGAPPAEATLPGLLAAAVAMVDGYLGRIGEFGQYTGACPDTVRDNAYLQLASELWARRNSPGGILSYGGDAGGIRLGRDPMGSVRASLAPYRAYVVG